MDQHRIASILNNIAIIYQIKGDYYQALELGYQSLSIAKEIGNRYMVGAILNNIAKIHYNKGDYEYILYYLLQVEDTLHTLNATEFQKSLALISSIKKELGIEEFNKLEENAARRISNIS